VDQAVSEVKVVYIDESEYMLLSDLCGVIPGKPTYETIRRWATQGVLSQNKARVKLQTVKLPTGRGSSIQLYRDFLMRLCESPPSTLEKQNEPKPQRSEVS
jgi:hypothetical protein